MTSGTAEFTFEQYDKKVGFLQVTALAWSSQSDVVAIALTDIQNKQCKTELEEINPSTNSSFSPAKVALYRYDLTLIWDNPIPTAKGCRVLALAWRPDGQMVTALTDLGHILHLHLKQGTKGLDVPPLTLDASKGMEIIEQSALFWLPFKKEPCLQYCDSSEPQHQQDPPNWSSTPWSFIMQHLPTLNEMTEYSDSDDREALRFVELFVSDLAKQHSLLLIHQLETVHFYINGLVPLLRLPVAPCVGQLCPQVLWSTLNSSSDTVYACARVQHQTSSTVHLVEEQIPLLLSSMLEIRRYSMVRSSLIACSMILRHEFQLLQQCWDDCISDFERKFCSYGVANRASNPKWSLQKELVELMLFGHYSATTKQFFSSLTEVEIQRMHSTCDSAYSEMKRILFQQIFVVLQRVFILLSELMDMHRYQEAYAVLHLDLEAVQQLMEQTSAAMLKTLEMLLVLNHSLKYLQAFLDWVLLCTLRVKPEGTQEHTELQNACSKNQKLIMDFVLHYMQPVEQDGRLIGYSIEIVRQYLSFQPLTRPLLSFIPEKENISEWIQGHLVAQPESLKPERIEGLFMHMSEASLATLLVQGVASSLLLTPLHDHDALYTNHVQPTTERRALLTVDVNMSDRTMKQHAWFYEEEHAKECGKAYLLWSALHSEEHNSVLLHVICAEERLMDTVRTSQMALAGVLHLDALPEEVTEHSGSPASVTLDAITFLQADRLLLCLSMGSYHCLAVLRLDDMRNLQQLHWMAWKHGDTETIDSGPSYRLSQLLRSSDIIRLPQKVSRFSVGLSRKQVFLQFVDSPVLRTYLVSDKEEDVDNTMADGDAEENV